SLRIVGPEVAEVGPAAAVAGRIDAGAIDRVRLAHGVDLRGEPALFVPRRVLPLPIASVGTPEIHRAAWEDADHTAVHARLFEAAHELLQVELAVVSVEHDEQRARATRRARYREAAFAGRVLEWGGARAG